MKTGRLLLLIAKDYLRRPFIWCIVLFMPILAILIDANKESINSHAITVGYYLEESSAEELTKLKDGFANYDGLYEFVPYDSVDLLKSHVARGKLECGYQIPADIFTLIKDKKAKDSITVYTSPATTMDMMLNETVFSLIFPIVSNSRLIDYMINDSNIASFFTDGSIDIKEIEPMFKTRMTDGSTFYVNYDGQTSEFRISTESLLLSPLKGLTAILILLAAFSGALNYYKEAENPVFKVIKVRFVYILIPTIYALISAFISQFLNINTTNYTHNTIALILYSLACVIFVFILTFIIKSPVLFASFIPIFLLGCIALTPIFVDIASFIPALKPASFLFLPYYYLIY